MLSSVFLPKNGCSQLIYEQAYGLTKRGHKVYLITRSSPQIPWFEELNGIKVFRVKYGKNAVDRLVFSLYVIKRGLELIGKNRVHVIHAYGPLAAVIGLIISRISTRPLIFSILDLEGLRRIIFHIGCPPSFGEKLHLRLSRLATKLLLKTSNKTLVPSNNVKKILLDEMGLKKFNSIKIDVIHPSVSLEDFHPKEMSHDGVNILHVGSLASRKGLDTLLMAYSLVVNTLRGTRLIIVGDGPMRKRLEMLAEELKMRESIGFIGFVPRNELPKYYAIADIFVHPSLIETYAMTLIEAMAMGKPAVATATTGSREMVEHGRSGLLIRPGNSRELAKAILKLILDDKLREAMGRYARKVAEKKYCTKIVVEKLEELYLTLF